MCYNIINRVLPQETGINRSAVLEQRATHDAGNKSTCLSLKIFLAGEGSGDVVPLRQGSIA
jgi:hypothetical protein